MTELANTESGHILLVERDENSCRMYRAMLEYQGFTVTVAGCEDAHRAASAPDLVALLINPFDCSPGAIERLRESVDQRRIPTLALTSRVTEPELVTVSEQGYDAVLIKPVTPRDVASAVKAALAHRRSNAQPGAPDNSTFSGDHQGGDAPGGARFAPGDRMATREFVDSHGTTWRVWSTIPKVSSPLAKYYPGGWLTFDAGGATLRRLSPVPAGWQTADPDRLELMCRVAPEVPRHTGQMVKMERPTEGPLAKPPAQPLAADDPAQRRPDAPN